MVESFRPLNQPVVTLEIEAYPEPKALSSDELSRLHTELGSNRRVAAHIGGSRGHVRDHLSQKRSRKGKSHE